MRRFSMLDSHFKKEEFKKAVKENVKMLYRKTIDEATQQQIFQAVSLAVKDVIIDNWLATQKQYEKDDPKIVYYLSMEFLMGRALGNNLINLTAYKEVKEALDELGFDLNVIEDQEPDPALGNGGLGRLAACFLDSLATLGYCAYGCGIRYHYGLFKQKIEDGYQIEVPDNWLKDGYPFELRRPEYAKEVKFGGYVRVEYDAATGRNQHRVPEVIDCWFDSGAMPFAQHHYPFENKELFEQQFPAQFISEAVDQTRGWFYSLLAESTLLFNKAPYQNVIVLGHVQDENGQKMSKSKGNAVDPFDALQTYGADAIRWYFYINSAPWLPNRFHGKAVQEGQRKFMSTLWNTYAFFVLYANIDEFDATKYTLDYDKLSVMDKWLLSKLNTVIQTVDDNLNNYRIPEAARALQEFVDDMSNWYVRRSRERFWAKGMEQDKINAYMTLYTSLVTISKVAAPMIPFMTEDIYQNLVRSIDKDAPESIHLCDFPVANKEWIDKDLEANMDHLLNVVVMGRACRNTANIKNRQPIAAMYVKAPYGLSEYFTAIIADELNVKEVKFTDNIENFISYSFKPQLKTVGPKYGKLLNGIRKALSELDGNKAMAELRANGELKLDIDGNEVVLSEGDLLIETAQMEGYVTESDNDIAVVLDTNLTPELIEEGFVREIISKIQTMRKEAGFEVMDKIQVYVKDNKVIEDIMKAHAEEIQAEVLAEKLLTDTAQGYVKSWNINSQEVTLGVEKMN